jgi:hypothetical protein
MPDFDGFTFGCCMTAFRPYDIAVCSGRLIGAGELLGRINESESRLTGQYCRSPGELPR